MTQPHGSFFTANHHGSTDSFFFAMRTMYIKKKLKTTISLDGSVDVTLRIINI